MMSRLDPKDSLAGSIQPGLGGGIIAHAITHEDLEKMVAEDPFVAHSVVTAEIREITPSKTGNRLDFLFGRPGSGQ